MGEAQKVRWGILGPGGIAKDFFAGVKDSRTGTLVAIGTRNPTKPGLAEAFPGARIVDGYDALIADPEVDAIYIAIPHPGHAEWAIKAAQRGKHVLCEKPMSLTAPEADAMIHAANIAGTFLGEAYMYRLHPIVAKLIELLKSGLIGDVRMIKSSFGFAMPSVMPEHRLYSSALAGGGILDIGGYPLSMVRLVAGVNSPSGFLDPDKISGVGHIGETGVDEWASAVLHFPNGIVAEVSCSISINQENVLRIHGNKGRIELNDFWFAGVGKTGGTGTIRVYDKSGAKTDIEVIEAKHLYSFEADAVAEAIAAGKQEFSFPGMSWADSLGNLRAMDKWRADIGLVLEPEIPANRPRTIGGNGLEVRKIQVPRGHINGLAKETSLVALGSEGLGSYSAAEIMFDAFYEAGGSMFDTAYMYFGGVPETRFGHWMKTRGVRKDVAIIAKGAHSPLCYPDVIGKQLAASLERMQTDHVDIYFMHRDNPDIPVGEFVDALDIEVKAGRIRGPFGGSNWTRTRMNEAIAYAERTGKAKPMALSNNFSLAEMVNPVWDGCIACSDDDWKKWLRATGVTNFAWSSQARGFFTDRAGPNRFDDMELANAWYSPSNFERRARAIELARRLGKNPIHVALAYVMAQEFQIVPLIGPRTPGELHDSLQAFEIKLTPEDVRWLESGS